MIVRLYHIPAEAIDDLREAFEDGRYYYCIAKWNLYRASQQRICDCPDGVELIKKHLPPLWKK